MCCVAQKAGVISMCDQAWLGGRADGWDLFRDEASVSNTDEQLCLAKELVALFKSGFRTEEELIAMARRSSFRPGGEFRR